MGLACAGGGGAARTFKPAARRAAPAPPSISRGDCGGVEPALLLRLPVLLALALALALAPAAAPRGETVPPLARLLLLLSWLVGVTTAEERSCAREPTRSTPCKPRERVMLCKERGAGVLELVLVLLPAALLLPAK